MQNNYKYDLQLLWEKTNNGLYFFEREFSHILTQKNKLKGFSVRSNDDTGSCYVSKSKNNDLYLFTDFGVDNKGINAIDYVMQKHHYDFNQACEFLFNMFEIPVNGPTLLKPETKYENNTDKTLEFWYVEFENEPKNYKDIFPFATKELLAEYNFKSIKSYQKVFYNPKTETNTLLTVVATPEYPIFGYDYKKFVKVYEPKANKSDKYQLKHHFLGEKPQRPVYGWDRLIEMADLKMIDFRLEDLKEATTPKEKKIALQELRELQIPNVIIATGGSDGINIASLGYEVLWFNSESEIINSAEYNILRKIAQNIYYCPDLDSTGIKQAAKMGMKHLDIKMIWLPEELKDRYKKDAADWVRLHKSLELEQVQNMFKQLLSQALQYKFWERNDKGTLSIKGKRIFQFLNHSGYYTYKILNNGSDKTRKFEEKIFVKVENNVVEQVFSYDIKEFVLQWLSKNFISLEVQEMILKSVFFSEKSQLINLPSIDFETKTGTVDSQIYFYENKAVKVTETEIKIVDHNATNIFVWKNNILPRKFTQTEPAFTISKNETGDYDIKILSNASNYFKVLINTSRIFWQKDEKNGIDTNKYNITSKNLTETEILLQKRQLINKIFCVGHLLHKYKQKGKDYFVLGIDRKISTSAKDSKGGSGKSFLIESLYNFLKNKKSIDGRNLHKDDDKFKFDGVTKETDLIFYDDITPYYDFNRFFVCVTGEMTANHKGGKMFDIEYKDVPKIAGTMNAVPYDINDSFRRRLVVYECCDYYHEQGEDYPETRTIATDFRKVLFNENYTTTEWQADDNFAMNCLQFYLSCSTKVEVQQSNLLIRNLIQQIGDGAMKFFTNLFEHGATQALENYGHNSDNQFWVHKKALYDLYKEELGQKAKTNQDFKEALIMYCKYKEWSIEFKKKKIDGIGTTVVEHFYITEGATSPPTTAPIPPPRQEVQTDLLF